MGPATFYFGITSVQNCTCYHIVAVVQRFDFLHISVYKVDGGGINTNKHLVSRLATLDVD